MNKLSIITLLFFLVACTDNQFESTQPIDLSQEAKEGFEYSEQNLERAQTTSTLAESTPEFRLEKGSKIIRNGRLEFEVTELQKAKEKIDQLVTQFDCYYENEQYNAYGNSVNYSLLIRIPNGKLDSLLFKLENGFGKLRSKNIHSQDVTEEYVDLKIRLDNNLAYLNQYQEILKKSKTIKDILEVQEKIRGIEEEIESKKGRLKYLDNKVNYSTLNIELSELVSGTMTNQPGFGLRISNAFKSGIQVFLNVIVFLVNLWPFILLLVLLWVLRKRIVKRVRGKE